MPLEHRDVKIRGKTRVIRHTWHRNPAGFLLTSTLLKEGTNQAAGKPLIHKVASLALVKEKGAEHAAAIQERAEKRGNQTVRAAAAAAAPAKRSGADARLSQSDPIATALCSGLRGGKRLRVAPAKPVKHSVSSCAFL